MNLMVPVRLRNGINIILFIHIKRIKSYADCLEIRLKKPIFEKKLSATKLIISFLMQGDGSQQCISLFLFFVLFGFFELSFCHLVHFSFIVVKLNHVINDGFIYEVNAQ